MTSFHYLNTLSSSADRYLQWPPLTLVSLSGSFEHSINEEVINLQYIIIIEFNISKHIWKLQLNQWKQNLLNNSSMLDIYNLVSF